MLLLQSQIEEPPPPTNTPTPACTDGDKRPDLPAEHCPLSLSSPSCTHVGVAVVEVEVVGAPEEAKAWTGTKI